jgi:hypothetical protein
MSDLLPLTFLRNPVNQALASLDRTDFWINTLSAIGSAFEHSHPTEIAILATLEIFLVGEKPCCDQLKNIGNFRPLLAVSSPIVESIVNRIYRVMREDLLPDSVILFR